MLQNIPVVILENFNFTDIDWQALSGSSPLSHTFCSLVFELNLLQLIESPTHIHDNILDLILTNTDDLIQDVVVVPHDVSPIPSDHSLINFSLSVTTMNNPSQHTILLAIPKETTVVLVIIYSILTLHHVISLMMLILYGTL